MMTKLPNTIMSTKAISFQSPSTHEFEDPTSDTRVNVIDVCRIHVALTEQERPRHLQRFVKASATALMADVCLTKFFGCPCVRVDAHVPLLTSGKKKAF
jgi:hypothetical protein